MMKTIEKVEKAIQSAALLHPFAEIGDMDAIFEMAEDLAQAAIQALDIIILPADAKPEVGDFLVTKDGKGWLHYSKLSRDIAKEGNCSNMKIIHRNGELAIQEPKEGA